MRLVKLTLFSFTSFSLPVWFNPADFRSERGGDAPQAKKRLRQIQIYLAHLTGRASLLSSKKSRPQSRVKSSMKCAAPESQIGLGGGFDSREINYSAAPFFAIRVEFHKRGTESLGSKAAGVEARFRRSGRILGRCGSLDLGLSRMNCASIDERRKGTCRGAALTAKQAGSEGTYGVGLPLSISPCIACLEGWHGY